MMIGNCFEHLKPVRFLPYFVAFAIFLSVAAGIYACFSEKKERMPALIPMPQRIAWKGKEFGSDDNGNRIIRRIVEELPGVPVNQNEAYMLDVTPDSVILRAKTQAGLFRGEQTIRQLTYSRGGKNYIATCSVTDWPAFAIRGFMQDAGRNYMSPFFLKEQIDVMAAYKYNLFHFHLTDNPGWRLGSRKYPQLKNPGTMSRWPGKYYSQEEFTDLVNYCDERFITLVPEIDVPGHCEAFRKAFELDSMGDPRVKQILLDLVDELCSLAPAEKMPYIHLGTDEVWHKYEQPANDLLPALVERVKYHRREVIVWRPGQQIENDNVSITQLWSSNGYPRPGHRYIDSRLNYLNHLDPLAGVVQLFFDRICGAPEGDSLRLGGILCCWNDNNVNSEYDIVRQNPVYPGMLVYSETSWKGQPADFGENYLAKLPPAEDPLFSQFQNLEERLISHRDLYFKGKPFPYVRQSDMVWSLIGPFDNGGDVDRSFPVEEFIKDGYEIDGKKYSWIGPCYGATIHIRHFFGFPSWFSEKTGTVYAATKLWSPADRETGFWIGFHDWSRSGGKRGGPFPQQGQWHKTNPKVWVNGKEVSPPVWKNPGLTEHTDEIPFSDENYFFREPAMINLKKGWNQVLLKVPQDGTSWKWMFTFVPVEKENENVHEVNGLKFKYN